MSSTKQQSDAQRRSSRTPKFPPLSHRLQNLFHSENPALGSTKMVQLRKDPHIYLIRDFLKASELKHLDTLLTQHNDKFSKSFTENESNEEILSSERTSTFLYLNKAQDPVARAIESRAANMIGMTSEFVEPLQIVSYVNGQKFETHHDAGTLLDDGNVELVPPRRLITIFAYLNTLPDGEGCTEFPAVSPPLRVTPEKGSAVLFCNVLPSGEADPRTIHRACPVTKGLCKIGMNVWIGDTNMQCLSQVKTRFKVDKSQVIDPEKSIFAKADALNNAFVEKLKEGSDKDEDKGKGKGKGKEKEMEIGKGKGKEKEKEKGKGKGKKDDVIVDDKNEKVKEKEASSKVRDVGVKATTVSTVSISKKRKRSEVENVKLKGKK